VLARSLDDIVRWEYFNGMTQNSRRHQGDTKTFDELTFAEQAKAINIKALWFIDATRSHVRKCAEVHGIGRAQDVPHKVAEQLRSMAEKVDAVSVSPTSKRR
jgi:hypothetical protein